MKYAVVYCSQSGNTEEVAEAVASSIPKEELVYVGEPDSSKIQEADVIFAGFWTDKGSCPLTMLDFLSQLHQKQIALFGTCGFGGSEEYYNVILQRVSALIEDDSTYLDGFMCQGKMGLGIRKRYEAMLETSDDTAKIQRMIDNFDHAMAHPDEDDLRYAKAFARIIVKSCE